MSLFPSLRFTVLLSFLGTAGALFAQTAGKVVPGPDASAAAKTEVTPALEPGGEPVLALVDKFDRHGTRRLDATERKEARDYLARLPRPPEPPVIRAGTLRPPPAALEPVTTGAKLTPASLPAVPPETPLYDPHTLRTMFLEFADPDWEQELAEFARTDVLIPARLTLDGRTFDEVGVRFLGPDAPAGYKHSLQLTLDYAHPGQTLGGRRLLELRAPQNDATDIRSLLYRQVAGDYLFTPAANFTRLVLNGENWGVYLNTQPFDDQFVQAHFGTRGGARFTATPGATLADLGADPAAYRRAYRLQTPEDPAAWAALVHLCQVLNQTPPDQLEAALAPLLDVDNALRFLALENTLVNQDGYWNRGSGYGLYLDSAGRFHFVPLETGTVLQYQQIGEFTGAGGNPGGGRRGNEGKGGDKAASLENSPEVKAYQRAREFPKQATTDLAMILSYSFVDKADRNDDRKLTRDELLDFIRSWFIVLDDDASGQISRPQFIAKFRNFISPPSVRDGRTRQTYGKEDAPAILGGDLFDAMDHDHDGQLTREKFMGAFDAWFTAWSEPKTRLLTEDGLRQGLEKVLTRTVFEADQTYIDRKNFSAQASPDANPGGRDSRGGGRRGRSSGGGESDSPVSASVGIPGLRIPTAFGKGGDSSNTVSAPAVAYRNEILTPLHGVSLPQRPLLQKLLAVPALRERYLVAIYEIAEKWLHWTVLGPLAQEYQGLIAAEVKQETHRPASYAQFVQQLDQDAALAGSGDEVQSLKTFITTRHAYLLDDPNLRHALGAR